MSRVSICDLRNRGGDIVERAERGERLTITRAGTPVVLVERRRSLPAVDPARLRRDLDALVDPDI